jgi:hypothetical protein
MERLEVELRREAARRRLAGESPRAIGRDLGRTRRWVAKWAARYDPHDPCWAEGRARAPKRVASRTEAGVEAVVLEIRSRLEENPWAQVGAPAIAWELEKLGAAVPPERTIEAILKRAGATRREGARRRASKGIPYPTPAARVAGDVVQVAIWSDRATSTAGCAFTRSTRSTSPLTTPGSRSSRIAAISVCLALCMRCGVATAFQSACSSTTAARSCPRLGSARSCERARRGPAAPTGTNLKLALHRARDVHGVGVDGERARALVPARRLAELARYGLAANAPRLRRHPSARRIATLVATVAHLQATSIDDCLELFDLIMTTPPWT